MQVAPGPARSAPGVGSRCASDGSETRRSPFRASVSSLVKWGLGWNSSARCNYVAEQRLAVCDPRDKSLYISEPKFPFFSSKAVEADDP